MVLHAFSALCKYSKFVHHPHPLGYLCAKCRFFRGLYCWASPQRKIAYSLNSPSLFYVPRTKALVLQNKILLLLLLLIIIIITMWTCYNDGDKLGAKMSVGREMTSVGMPGLKVGSYDTLVGTQEVWVDIAAEMLHRSRRRVQRNQIRKYPADWTQSEPRRQCIDRLVRILTDQLDWVLCTDLHRK